jgi:dihydrofolate reductase
MGHVIATHFVTLDGVASDPDGRWGSDHGGWAFRYGQGPVSEDKFRLGDILDEGVQLYGRRTWEHFSRLWPSRDGDFARRMNAAGKFVATRTGIDPDAWSGSTVVDGDLLTWVSREREDRDVVVIGSLDVLHQLATADLVDEYRLITFPVVAGSGDRIFAEATPGELTIESVVPNDPDRITVLSTLRRVRASTAV